MSTKKSKAENLKKSIGRDPLDIEKIVKAALKLLNEVGLEQLTTRRLAETLGIRSASLYWHVRDKSELLQLLCENICAKVQLPDTRLSWDEQVLYLAREYRTTLLSVRDSAEVLIETPPLTPKRLSLMESMFKALADAGFPPKEIIMASMLMNDYVLSFVKNEMIMLNMKLNQGVSTQEASDNPRSFFSSLPADQYPTIVGLADYMTFDDMDEQYVYGVHIILDSLKNRLKNKQNV